MLDIHNCVVSSSYVVCCRPFFVKLETYHIKDSIVYFDIDVVSQHLAVNIYRRYSEFLEVSEVPLLWCL